MLEDFTRKPFVSKILRGKTKIVSPQLVWNQYFARRDPKKSSHAARQKRSDKSLF
jgi:hypothetical protein